MINVTDPDLHSYIKSIGFKPRKPTEGSSFSFVYIHSDLTNDFPILSLTAQGHATVVHPLHKKLAASFSEKELLLIHLSELILSEILES